MGTDNSSLPKDFTLSKKINLAEYKSMFEIMEVDSTKAPEIDSAFKKIVANKSIYESIIEKSKNPLIPYYTLGIVHYMECNLSFKKHIHNGDSLNKRTINVPSGRPISDPISGKGKPYTFEESSLDWIYLKKWNLFKDWKAEDILARFELNNGLGYRKLGIPSPYLWSYSQFYGTAPFIGKYVADSKFEKFDAKGNPIVSQQIGSAILLKKFL